ncbi:hypothetical protein PRIPAC_71202 [Pristionchus pacificus]|uniref:Uncharacterized protein n=1 Tax=Pristionchus pacificus TaxID=54126 RepID=A0A2A6C6G5_PRIPA|nr:hypothetical protein PRIPAC_71202 [Pristionchus pacificus]|eukprot:PDM73749.1 hypothetical protein PRIPAC_41105 [Pristionchus pacificus]
MRNIKRMMENAALCKLKFFDYRDQILDKTVHVQDESTLHLDKPFSFLISVTRSISERIQKKFDLELDRLEPLSQRDVELRVHKARKTAKAFEKLMNQMEMTKNSEIETVAKEVDALMVIVNEISKRNTKRKEESKKLKRMKQEKRDEMEEERKQPLRRMGIGDIKEEPLDQYVFDLNQNDVRDGEARGASSRYTVPPPSLLSHFLITFSIV